MFVKKDLRKIPRILSDATSKLTNIEDASGLTEKENKREVVTELQLARRPAEFDGSISILLDPSNAVAFKNIVRMSLYDCQIKSLDGIGFFGSPIDDNYDCCCPNLEELNVGRNPISLLPSELSMLSKSLKSLWCDDCQIAGPIPDCVINLKKLESLRISNNNITSIPETISTLENLEILCLDGNQIKEVPIGIGKLRKLKSLLLRKNDIESLPSNLPVNLNLLHVSSNKIHSLPNSLVNCLSLETVYANTNLIKNIPDGIASKLVNLKKLNLSHNHIESLPADFMERFGDDIINTDNEGILKDSSCTVLLVGNPVLKKD